MKNTLAITILSTFSFFSLAHTISNQDEYASSAKTIPVESYANETKSDYIEGTTRHIVLFDLKDDVTPAQTKEIIDRFLALKSSKRDGKPYIKNIEVGTGNISKEGQGKGYDLSFTVSFASKGDLNYYVGTPAISDPKYFDANHQKFKDFVGPLLKIEKNPDGSKYVGVLVFDYQL
ncbi:Dabb family protein [Vibrio aquimaris]|uniref:Stress responsive A/B Barrel Domain protein n=1 Tax=Vibrio aquimaris TaxID=2587862 RepID=A0A5P9CJ10_9VIBR|nr:Dabb family protein [Vibrio aquimaris]QFT26214.1 Stress responsive A/B Barrel Domain protein [Vibrio aquimaris]